MITTTCQRWRERRDTYRPAGETIRTQHYEVIRLANDSIAKAFVLRHHYSHSFPAARERFGLYCRGELAGVAVLSHPASQAALDAALPLKAHRAELGRFVLLDSVPANGESWFLGRCFEIARRLGYEAIVSHSDPVQRTTAEGSIVFVGHIGTVYQATNASYVGLTPARTWRILPDGSVLSARALSKLRAQERGWRYVLDLLVRYGAPEPTGDWRTWCRHAVHVVSRPFRHHGTHRYVWALNRRLHAQLPASKPYPKWHDASAAR